ncbi:MAG: outer membrane beta-barrel protein [Cyclobacteriaceae bacterium]
MKKWILCIITFCAYTFGFSQTPFEGIDQTWQNGSDRRDSSVFKNVKYFTPSILIDLNVNHSFNDPIDHTVVGSTALARTDEMQLSALHFGGDFNVDNVRGRFMTQFGTRSVIIPRNDFSVFRGQYQLADVYRYLSEANAGYHFNKWHGINVDAGLFMSYIGLNSFYQAENWEYQASFTSDNTPWFFNGIRVQIFPNKNWKIEPWIINGWQSYGSFNAMPGFGGSVTYMSSNSNLKVITNDYYGTDTYGHPGRIRVHSDNSVLVRYYNEPNHRGITKMAFSLTGDIGYEKGDGVNGFKDGGPNNPAQYFLSTMFYNRIWFAKSKMAWTIGGGWMKNPGRYLVLYPTGQASPLPNPNNPTQTLGAYPFDTSPGTSFEGWDCSTNIDLMPSQYITFRLEAVHRQASVPYFAGHGGVTSPDGYTTTPVGPNSPNPNWRPDLTKCEAKIILAILFRL